MAFASHRTFVLLNLSFAIALQGLAQSPAPYLEKIKHPSSDTALINTYNWLTDHYISDKDDSARYFNERSIAFSNSKQKDNFNFKGYYFKAELLKNAEKYSEALKIAEIAKQIAKKNRSLPDEIEIIDLEGVIMQAADLGELAVANFRNAYELSKQSNDKKGLLHSGLHLGLYYKDINENTKSLEYLIQTYPIAEQLQDTNTFFTCAINMGTLFERTKDLDKALMYYKKALSLNDPHTDSNAAAICYFKIGRIFATQLKKDSAEYYLEKTMQIHLKMKAEKGLIFDYAFLASVYLDQKEYKKAESLYDTSLTIALKLKDSVRISAVYSYIGGMYNKRNDPERSLLNYKKSLDYSTKKTPDETTMMVYKNIAEMYQKQGRYKEAFENYILFKAWTDSAHDILETKKQTEIKLGFEFNQVQEKMKAEADAKEMVAQAQLEKEKQQRNFLVAVLALISLSLVLVIRSQRTKQKANRLLKIQKLEIQKQKEDLEDKQMEILDSIHYAKRIQQSLMPTERYIDRAMKRLNKNRH